MDEEIGNFDNIIQIINVTSQIINVHIDGEILEPLYYREAFNVIRDASENDLINIYINSIGGDISTFIEFYNLISECNARVVAYLYMGYSCAAMLALICPELVLTEFCSLLIHAPSGEAIGKVGEIKSHGDFFKEWSEEIITSTYRGYLTDKEIEKVLEGKEIWHDRKEIEKRLLNRDKLLKRK
jgi:ATP-dependent protease ClpP protease subunit